MWKVGKQQFCEVRVNRLSPKIHGNSMFLLELTSKECLPGKTPQDSQNSLNSKPHQASPSHSLSNKARLTIDDFVMADALQTDRRHLGSLPICFPAETCVIILQSEVLFILTDLVSILHLSHPFAFSPVCVSQHVPCLTVTQHPSAPDIAALHPNLGGGLWTPAKSAVMLLRLPGCLISSKTFSA